MAGNKVIDQRSSVRAGVGGPASHHNWDMEETMDSFVDLYRRLLKINFLGVAGVALPEGPALSTAVSDGVLLLPHDYVVGYGQPLETNLRRLLRLIAVRRLDATTLETLTGAA